MQPGPLSSSNENGLYQCFPAFFKRRHNFLFQKPRAQHPKGWGRVGGGLCSFQVPEGGEGRFGVTMSSATPSSVESTFYCLIPRWRKLQDFFCSTTLSRAKQVGKHWST